MGTHTARSRFGEPGADLAMSLGRLLVSGAQLRQLQEALTGDNADAWAPGDALVNWNEFTDCLLELRDRIVAASAVMRFTGSSGEHLTIEGPDAVRIPADAAYISTLSRRMDRHARFGRVMVGASAEREQIAV